MEKCEFCSRMVLFGKKDVSNLLGARPVVLGDGEPVKRLELWLFGGEVDEQSVLHIGVSDYGGEENMMEMNIPINYVARNYNRITDKRQTLQSCLFCCHF